MRCWCWFTIIVCCLTTSTSGRSLLFAERNVRLTALICLHVTRRINPLLLLSSATIVAIARIHHHYHLCGSLYRTAGTSCISLTLLHRSPLLLSLMRMEIGLGDSWLDNLWGGVRDHRLMVGPAWGLKVLVQVRRDYDTLHARRALLDLLGLLRGLLVVWDFWCLLQWKILLQRGALSFLNSSSRCPYTLASLRPLNICCSLLYRKVVIFLYPASTRPSS